MENKEQPTIGFIITNPLTGRPMEKTPSGISLENMVFNTKEDLEKFVFEHWDNPVFCAEINTKS